jgi:hypothetical protein
MISQALLDLWTHLLVFVVNLVPAIPPEVTDMLDQFADSLATLGTYLAKLGPLLPFEAIAAYFVAFGIALGWWAVMQIVRVVAWLFGR